MTLFTQHRLDINEFSEQEKSYLKPMTSLLEAQTNKIKKLISENPEEVPIYLKKMISAVQDVGKALQQDILFLHHILENANTISQLGPIPISMRESFIFDLIELTTTRLPSICAEKIFYPRVLLKSFSALQEINQQIQNKNFAYQDQRAKLVSYLLSAAQDSFTSNADYMRQAIKTHSTAVKFVSGDLLNPEKSSNFYFRLYMEGTLSLAFIPEKIQSSESFQNYLDNLHQKRLQENIFGFSIGLCSIAVGVLCLTQIIPLSLALSLILGSAITLVGACVMSYFCYEILYEQTMPLNTSVV